MRKPVHSLRSLPRRCVLPLLVLLALLCTPAAAHAGPPDDPDAGNAAAPRIVLNEVVPKPDGRIGVEWIELYYLDPAVTLQYQFFPTISKLGITAARSSTPDPAALETPAAVDISGWRLREHAGLLYTMPDALPRPAGHFVVIYFDGLGAAADHYGFTAGAAVLHSSAGIVDASMTARTQLHALSGSRTRPPRCATSSPGAARRSMPAMP